MMTTLQRITKLIINILLYRSRRLKGGKGKGGKGKATDKQRVLEVTDRILKKGKYGKYWQGS